MSSYLKNLLAKSVQQAADIRPRLGSRFEGMPPAAFSDSEPIDQSFFQEQASGIQPHGDGIPKDHTHRPENVSLETNAPDPAVHTRQDAGETRASEGGRGTLIAKEKRSVVRDLQVEQDDHGLVSQALKGQTGRQEQGKSSGSIRPLLHEAGKETGALPVQAVTRTSVQQQDVESAPPFVSSPGRERAGRRNGLDRLNSKQKSMVDTADRNARDFDRDAPRIRPEPAEKSKSPGQSVEPAPRLPQPDIAGRYGDKKITPSVQVTIGRIEIRAVREQKLPPRAAGKQASPQRPALSLDEYLSQRSERGR